MLREEKACNKAQDNTSIIVLLSWVSFIHFAADTCLGEHGGHRSQCAHMKAKREKLCHRATRGGPILKCLRASPVRGGALRHAQLKMKREKSCHRQAGIYRFCMVSGNYVEVAKILRMQGGPYHPPLWHCHWVCNFSDMW